MSFYENIKNFSKISGEDALKFIEEKEEFILFIGRATCPFCNLFVPKLKKVVEAIDKAVYFLDSDDYTDSKLEDLRNRYAVKTVPGLLVTKNNQTKVVCDSSLSEENIKDFILN